MSIPPSEDIMKKMFALGLVRIRDGAYTHSFTFESVVFDIHDHPPGRFAQLKMAHTIEKDILPVLLAHGVQIFKEGEEKSNLTKLGNLATAAIALDKYLKATKFLYDKNDIPNFIYTIYYMNIKAVPINE